MKNEKDELIAVRKMIGWCMCVDHRKLNRATKKDHFPLPFIGQMWEKLVGYKFYCCLDGYSSYNQIPVALEDKEKVTFTCPYGIFAYKIMPFELCKTINLLGMHDMMFIFLNLLED